MIETRSKEKCVKLMDRRQGVGDGLSHRARRKERKRDRQKVLGRDGGGVLWLFCHICNLCLMLPGYPGNFLMWKRTAQYY